VTSSWVGKLSAHRITLTLPVLNAAAEVVFLVTGRDKAFALSAALREESAVEEVPARGVRPTRGRLVFVVDRAAAAELPASVLAAARAYSPPPFS
jgi:6-phosphogluconolactonase